MENTVLVKININGETYEDYIPESLTLLDYLRDYRGLMGTKKGCGVGECGACTVILNGRAVYSCILLATQADGKNVVTIEGLNEVEKLHPIQEAYVEAGAIQCGFCTPGMIMSTKALLDHNSKPDEEEIKEGLSGNLCRCTGYVQIIDAVKKAAEKING